MELYNLPCCWFVWLMFDVCCLLCVVVGSCHKEFVSHGPSHHRMISRIE